MGGFHRYIWPALAAGLGGWALGLGAGLVVPRDNKTARFVALTAGSLVGSAIGLRLVLGARK